MKMFYEKDTNVNLIKEKKLLMLVKSIMLYYWIKQTNLM